MSSPNRDTMQPGSGKVLDSGDAIFDVTALMKLWYNDYLAGGLKTQGGEGGGGSGGFSGGGSNTVYSNVVGDFTATANAGAKTITFSSYASTLLSATISALNFSNAVIKRVSSGGAVDILPLTTVSFSANVLTLTDMSANFAAGDTVAVFVMGPAKSYDKTNDIQKHALTDGTNQVGVITAGADATNNTSNRLEVSAHLKVFNGSTWDRLRSAVTTIGSTFTGFLNALPWGIYHSLPTTRTDGQGGPLETDSKGNLQTNLYNKIAGEDLTNDVMKTEEQWSYATITTATTTTIKSGGGIIGGVEILGGTLGAITAYDNTAGSGTPIFPTFTPTASAPCNVIGRGTRYSTGLTIVTAAATIILVKYR